MRRIFQPVLFVAALSILPTTSAANPPAGSSSPQADALYAAKNYAAALPLYKRAAEHGDGVAAYRAAGCYRRGLGVAPDYPEAFRLYKLGAAAGDVQSMNELGYFYGQVMRQPNPSEAMKWYQKAAEGGNTSAMINTAIYYQSGEGGIQDCDQAMSWLRRADGAGDGLAANVIGMAYEAGNCAPVDSISALSWYKKGVSRGDDDSKIGLSRLIAPYQVPDQIVRHHACDAANAPAPGVDEAVAVGIANADGGQDAAARTCFEFAARAGNASAQTDLAYAYEHGLGGPTNGVAALTAYQDATVERPGRQPNSLALTNLVRMYREGKIVAQDLAGANRLSASRDDRIRDRTTTCSTAPVRDAIIDVEWSFILGTPVTAIVNVANQAANKPPRITGIEAIDGSQMRGHFLVDLAANSNSFVCEVHFAKDAIFHNTADELELAIIAEGSHLPVPELGEVRQFFRIAPGPNHQYAVTLIPSIPRMHAWAQVISPSP